MRNVVLLFMLLINNMLLFSQAQEDVLTRYKDKTRRVYWFDLALKTKVDKETNLPMYYVFPVSKVKYGTAEEFDRYLWNNISAGTYMAVGPFDNQQQAELSQKLYDPKLFEKDSTLLTDDRIFYYYVITLKKRTRLKSFEFERIPAAVAPGKPRDFVKLIQSSIMVDRLVIGAFSTLEEAENSKRVYRLQE